MHFGAQLVWGIAMSEFPVCNIMAFLRTALHGPSSAEDGPSSPGIWDSGMLVSLPTNVCESLEKMGAMADLCDPVFDIPLGDMTKCRTGDVHWLLVMSS